METELAGTMTISCQRLVWDGQAAQALFARLACTPGLHVWPLGRCTGTMLQPELTGPGEGWIWPGGLDASEASEGVPRIDQAVVCMPVVLFQKYTLS